MDQEYVRINKYLSDMGICSRREADRLIEKHLVLIDGQAAEAGQKVCGQETILVNGKPVRSEEKERPVVLAYHKPRGVVCTTSGKDRAQNVIEALNYPVRVVPVGRLDKDSEGLLLMTNEGWLVDAINRSGNYHEKEYLVDVLKPVSEDFLCRMAEGVTIEVPVRDEIRTVRTRQCKVRKLSEKRFSIVLTQGYNRQIRRMCDALGNHVTRLKRVRVMNIELGDLKPGKHREVTGEELTRLREHIHKHQTDKK